MEGLVTLYVVVNVFLVIFMLAWIVTGSKSPIESLLSYDKTIGLDKIVLCTLFFPVTIAVFALYYFGLGVATLFEYLSTIRIGFGRK